MMKSVGIGFSLCAWFLLGASCGDNAARSSFHVSGTISGLTAAGLVIENNGGDDDTIAIDTTSFQFPTEIELGGGYLVTVLTQPTGLQCTVTNGSGTDITADVINVAITCAAPAVTFSVTPSGTDVSITPDSAQVVASGASQAFTVTPDDGFTLSNAVGGTCAAGSWNDNVYTTGAITADCTVIFSATQATFTVTPSADNNLMVEPFQPQAVADGSTQAFTLFANVGYSVSQIVGGTCPAGSWNDNVYTTGAITADCSVSFTATLDNFTVTPSGDDNESISPNTPQTVGYSNTQSFTVTPNTDFEVTLDVGGTCPSGSWLDSIYTTGAIIADCSVSFAATSIATTISASVASLTLATSGTARTITITNTGSSRTNGLQAEFPTFPSGTTADFGTCTGDLDPTETCTITVTPGSTTSATPLTITVGGSNTNVVDLQVGVVTFGSIYQGGYIFAIDDTTDSGSSIGGSIVALDDNGTVAWGTQGTVTNASSLTDGATNTATIISTLGNGTYAAALCSGFSIDDSGNSPCSSGTCYSSWYLPSICEMSNNASDANCATGTPNIFDNVGFLIGGCVGSECLIGKTYWSSTENSGNPGNDALAESYQPVDQDFLASAIKSSQIDVRCARALTP